jgi:hypothetical protein
MSRLIDFYRGEGTDIEGRTLSDLWSLSDLEMEEIHDFIQWMFPLREPSQFNPDAPLLTAADIAAFRAEPVLRANLLRSFDRFLAFLGLIRDGERVVETPGGSGTSDVWLAPNHNWLRITRVLHSLRLLGLDREARAFFDCLQELYRSGRTRITTDTFRYWDDAARGGET